MDFKLTQTETNYDVLAQIYPRREAYGSGIFRRRVRVRAGSGIVTAVLNDAFHSMWLRLHHDGQMVTEVESELNRFPKTTCPSAVGVISELRGLSLNADRREFYKDGRAGRNCTHLLDMGLLSLGVLSRNETETVFDVEIPDFVDGQTELTARVNGAVVHHWQLENDIIVSPDDMVGRGLFKGYSAWAESRFSGVELDAARVVQKAVFVSKGRKYKVDGLPRVRAMQETHRHGDCHSFSYPSVAEAVDNVGFVVDTTLAINEPNLERAMLNEASQDD